jgi:signal transduction histidine kinase
VIWLSWSRWTVRTRTVAAAVILLAITLAATGFVLRAQVRTAQIGAIDRALTLESASVSALARDGHLPAVLNPASQETSFVQVLNANQRVIAASASVFGEGPIVPSIRTRIAGVAVIMTNLPIGSGDAFRVRADRISTSAGFATVVTGESLGAVNRAVSTLTTGLLLVDPLVLLLAGLIIWLMVKRAFAPIEAIRTEVDTIATSVRGRRVPVPPTVDEIGRLASTMNMMLARLEEAEAGQRRFLSDASHELKSPLAAAQAELEVALGNRPDANWPSSARAVLGDLERVRRIVDDLLILTKIDEGKGAPPYSDVDLDDIVLESCERLRRLETCHVDVRGVSAGRVWGDPEQLARVVRNLLDNAVAHTTSIVTVTLTRSLDVVELRVADDGGGIKEADHDLVFERFARLDTARTRNDGGSGLGLAIVAEVVTQHGGSVAIEDGAPGATFVVRFRSREEDLPIAGH